MSAGAGGDPWGFMKASDRHLPQLKATASQVYASKAGKQACKVPLLTALALTARLSEQQPHLPAQSPVANRRPVALHPENPSGARSKGLEGAAGFTHGRLSHTGADMVCAHQRRRRRNRQVRRKDTDPGLDSPQTPPASSVQHPHSVPSLLTAPPSMPGSLPARATFSFRPPWQGLL